MTGRRIVGEHGPELPLPGGRRREPPNPRVEWAVIAVALVVAGLLAVGLAWVVGVWP